MNAVWIDSPMPPDTHVAFRAAFDLPAATLVDIHLLSSAWFLAFLDGQPLSEGSPRFDPAQPEHLSLPRQLSPGRHLLALHALYEGVPTKRQPLLPPFVFIRVRHLRDDLPLTLRAALLPGYRSQTRRINNDLGWIDWCNAAQNPADWHFPTFDDTAWSTATPVENDLAPPSPSSLRPLAMITHPLAPLASGPAAEAFAYPLNDPPARFFLRDLACTDLPPRGVFRRFDLGRVRLGRPRFTLNTPSGTTVEFASAEALRSGRVAPYITLSNGPSCNLDHFESRGGVETFEPTTPKGGRFLELHVIPPPGSTAPIQILSEEFLERTYHPDIPANFTTDDDLLNRIWLAGAETYRACAEDGITDNPTRERGQWTGDALVALETASATTGDLSLLRRALIHAGHTTRAGGGLVQCLSPDQNFGAIPHFAMLWINAVMRFHRYTGDGMLLRDTFDDAKRTMLALEKHLSDDGLRPDPATWNFIDWGYAPPAGGGAIDLALNLHYLSALRNFCAWTTYINREEELGHFYDTLHRVVDAVQDLFTTRLRAGGYPALGFHAAALALAANTLIDPADQPAAIDFLKQHILSCFPNDPAAPRLEDPSIQNPRLITPFFLHFVFPALIEHGQMDFVLSQYRSCWGWMLDAVGSTTCLEVFDPRWSHCHQWSACPTWQLSRYALGLHPRFDRGNRHFDLNLQPGSLTRAAGRIPLADGAIDIEWRRTPRGIDYTLTSPNEVHIHNWYQPEFRTYKGTTKLRAPATPPTINQVPTWASRLTITPITPEDSP